MILKDVFAILASFVSATFNILGFAVGIAEQSSKALNKIAQGELNGFGRAVIQTMTNSTIDNQTKAEYTDVINKGVDLLTEVGGNLVQNAMNMSYTVDVAREQMKDRLANATFGYGYGFAF